MIFTTLHPLISPSLALPNCPGLAFYGNVLSFAFTAIGMRAAQTKPVDISKNLSTRTILVPQYIIPERYYIAWLIAISL